jgi:hypothetical protein
MIGRNAKGEMSMERGMERLPKLLTSGSEVAIAIENRIIEGDSHWSQESARSNSTRSSARPHDGAGQHTSSCGLPHTSSKKLNFTHSNHLENSSNQPKAKASPRV